MMNKELYHGDNFDVFLKIKKVLDNNGISYKEHTKRNDSWITFITQLFTVGKGALGRNDEHKQHYFIYIYENDYDNATKLINTL